MPNKAERIGNMREQIVIQSVSEDQSSSGFPEQTWSTYSTVWAAVTYRINTSDEKEMADRKTAETTAVFRIRYDSAVTEKHRISYNSQVWDITGIAVTPDLFYMELEAKKRV